jgi:hypothetical protein
MSLAGARWLAALGAGLLLTACTTTIDHAVPTRASTADSDIRAVGSADASPPISVAVAHGSHRSIGPGRLHRHQ